MELFKKILYKYWKYTSFRELQEEIIISVYEGNDTLALMPTGGGKSITYQVPALAKKGLCLVISPLIALIKDQVESLRKKGINAEYIISGMNEKEIISLFDKIDYLKDSENEVKFLYVAPERLKTKIFIERIKNVNVNLIAVDEAHCISQWGYDFRPSYLEIAKIREILKDVPILAVTASATPDVIEDIQNKLLFKKRNVLKKTFERKNLTYKVIYSDNKLKTLIDILNTFNGTGIIYARSRKKTVEISELLRGYGLSVGYYHAGMNINERNKTQEEWLTDKIKIIVATNAFGMGIDKPNVRFVIHIDPPECIESYFQEAGRAGRDNLESFAIIITNEKDKLQLLNTFEKNYPSINFIQKVYHALGNYFQIPIGCGQFTEHIFDLEKFCKIFNFPLLDTHNAIKFLILEGYINLTDNVNLESKIKFLVDRIQLYEYQMQHPEDDIFIKMLLRSYSGLFTEYTKISETTIAKTLHYPEYIVKEKLIKLKKNGVIDYIEKKEGNILTYLNDRIDHKSITLTNRYFFIKERAKNRLNEMINYLFNKNKCRSQFLLNYFGETNTIRCGKCDVCEERNVINASKLEFDIISSQIKSLCLTEPQELSFLIEKINFNDKNKIINVIQWLLDHNKLVFVKPSYVKWNSGK